MITEIDRFHEEVRKDPEFKRGVGKAADAKALVAFAAGKGFQFTAEELEQWSKPKLAGELTDADLTAVIGGKGTQPATQTAGGGNTSIWGKIKSIAFGVDASFYD
ncbi:MAG TPA: Nif11-like leader peptide family RiPP precursor [Verrucomicrobiaceae bacterium]